MNTRVSAVIVTYNSGHVLPSLLASITEIAEIIVVDNASTDESIAILRRHRPDARLIELPENMGFGRAANLGLAAVNSEFGFLLNPDIVLRPGALQALLTAADHYPKAGMLSPTILNPDGTNTPIRKMPLGHLSPLVINTEELRPGDLTAPYIGCSAMFLRMAAFRKIGGFDPNFFLFSEDDDLLLKLAKCGWGIVQIGDGEAVHESGKSSQPRADLEWLKQWHIMWSYLYLVGKHVSPTYARRLAIGKIFLLGAKWILYAPLFNFRRLTKYGGQLHGAVAYLRGLPATHRRI